MGFLFVGIGGALGAMLRYCISLIPTKTTFPVLTLITNIIGAFLIGVFVAYGAKKNISANMMLLLKTGLCGGFTTFSTFSLESLNLFKGGKPLAAIVYGIVSLAGCILCVELGMKLVSR